MKTKTFLALFGLFLLLQVTGPGAQAAGPNGHTIITLALGFYLATQIPTLALVQRLKASQQTPAPLKDHTHA